MFDSVTDVRRFRSSRRFIFHALAIVATLVGVIALFAVFHLGAIRPASDAQLTSYVSVGSTPAPAVVTTRHHATRGMIGPCGIVMPAPSK